MPVPRWRAVALGITGLVLAGCPNGGSLPSVAPMGSVSPAASQRPVAAPSPAASGGVASTPTPAGSILPLGAKTLVKGRVYDEAGAPLDGVTVRARSLDARAPFDQTQTTVAGGFYSFVDVPAGAQIEMTAARTGYTARTRVQVLLESFENIANFGGDAVAKDLDGPMYFISDFPEVTAVSPAHDEVVEGDRLTVRLTFSEPLDAANRFYAEKALAIDASQEPVATGTLTLGRSTGFMENQVVSKVVWNEAGDTMTYTFDAPLLASDKEDKPYAISLVRRAGDAAVRDASGNLLGLIEPSPEASYAMAIKTPTLVASAAATPEERWRATHKGSSVFKVRKQAPSRFKLVGVTAHRLSYNNVPSVRFVLEFDRPLRVFAGDGITFKANLGGIGDYVFALSEKSMDAVSMTAAPGQVASASEAAALMDPSRPFTFAAGTIDFASDSPHLVTVTVADSLVPTAAQFVKVKVEAVTDPLGNPISTDGENRSNLTADHVKIGTL